MVFRPLLVVLLALVAPPLRADDAVLSVPLTVVRSTTRHSLEELRRDAERGDSGAQQQLGIRYQLGDGVAQDYQAALRLYRLAAKDPKNKAAPTNIGVMYDDGLGVDRDYREALRWYQIGYQRGSAVAANNIGMLFQHGQGVATDYHAALRWYRLGDERGDG